MEPMIDLVVESIYLTKVYRVVFLQHGKIRDEIELESRNDSLKIIRNLGNDQDAFSLWKKLVGYHKRSLVETAFSRLKRHFGERLSNKTTSNLEAEVTFRCHVLNRMNSA